MFRHLARTLTLALLLLACGDDDPAASTTPAPSPTTLTPTPTPPPALKGIDFGSIDCGTAPRGAIAIPNSSANAFTWRASVSPATYFALEGVVTGTIAPNASEVLTVRADTSAAGLVPGAPVAGVVTIETSDARAPRIELPVRFIPEGAKLEPIADLDFGLVPVAAPPVVVGLGLRNTGSRPLSVALSGAHEDGFTVFADTDVVEVAPGDKKDASMRFAPRSAGFQKSEVPLALQGVVCGERTAKIRATASTYGGSVAVSASALDLGGASCNVAPSPKTLTLTNYGSTSATWTANLLQAATGFQYSPATGTLDPGKSVDITISRNAATAPGNAVATLRLSLPLATHDVSLAASTVGASLRVLNGATYLSPDTKLLTVRAGTIEVVNDGNAPVTLTPSVDSTEFAVANTPITVSGFGSASIPVSFRPTKLGDLQATLSFQASSTCGGAQNIALQGHSFLRAARIWGARGAEAASTYYANTGLCFELDDGRAFCNDRIVSVPADAQLLFDTLDGYACYRPANATTPLCYDNVSDFAARSDLTGFQSHWGSFGLTDAGGVVQGSTPVAGLTGVKLLSASYYGPTCALRDSGAVECFGGGYLMNALGAVNGGYDVANRVALPEITDAGDVAQLSANGVHCVLAIHSDDTLTLFRAYYDSSLTREKIAGIADAVEVRGDYDRFMVRRASGLVSAIQCASGPPLHQLVPLSNVVSIGFHNYYRSFPTYPYSEASARWQFVRNDGRVFESTVYDPVGVTARVGFDR